METSVLGLILLGLLIIAAVPLQNLACKEGGFSIFNVGTILLNLGALGVAVACLKSGFWAWMILMQLAEFTARPFDEQPARVSWHSVLRRPHNRREVWICGAVTVFMAVFLGLVAFNLFDFREVLAAMLGPSRYESIFLLLAVVGFPVAVATHHLDPRKWMQVMWCAAAMGLAWILALVTHTPIPSLSAMRF